MTAIRAFAARVLAMVLLVGLGGLGWPAPAQAAEFHVGTAAELAAALGTAQTNGEDDIIVLAPGTYVGNFSYTLGDGKALTLRGAEGTRPEEVVLDGGGSGTVLTLYPSAAGGTVRLEDLTVQRGGQRGLRVEGSGSIHVILSRVVVQDNRTDTHGGGIRVYTWANGAVTMDIRDSVIRRNEAANRGGGIHAHAYAGNSTVDLLIVNTLIYGNRAGWSSGGVQVSASEVGENNVARAVVVHSTITGNTCGITSPWEKGGGLWVYAYQGTGARASLDLYNTILYGNFARGGEEVQDLYIGERSPGEAVANAYFSDVGMVTLGTGLPTYTATSVISADPAFADAAAGDYHLTAVSPCRDTGTEAVPDPPGLPAYDFEGQPRVMGPAPDIGVDEFGMVRYLPLALKGR
ncbi:MAG: hypothetical protein ACP5UM_03955 [Anaerolineae bacterium]